MIQEEFSIPPWLKRESSPSEEQQERGLELSYLREQKVPTVHQQLLLAIYGRWSPPMEYTVTWFYWEIHPAIYISLLHFGALQFYQMLSFWINIFYSCHHMGRIFFPPFFLGLSKISARAPFHSSKYGNECSDLYEYSYLNWHSSEKVTLETSKLAYF